MNHSLIAINEKVKVIIPHPFLQDALERVGTITWHDCQRHTMHNDCGVDCSLKENTTVGFGAFGRVWRYPRKPNLVIYIGVYHRWINMLSVGKDMLKNPYLSDLLTLPIGLVRVQDIYIGIMPYKPARRIGYKKQLALAEKFYSIFSAIERAGFVSLDPGLHNWGIDKRGCIVGYDIGSYKKISRLKHKHRHAEHMMMHWLLYSEVHNYQEIIKMDQLRKEQLEQLLSMVERHEWAEIFAIKKTTLLKG